MNLRWLKQNLIVIVPSVVFVAVLALIVFWERKASTRKDEVLAQLEQQQAELNRLRSLDPTPAMENIDVLRHDREQVQQMYRQLQQGAVREPINVPELKTGDDFSLLMRERLTGLREAARNRVTVPEAFLFGFSRYDQASPCRGTGIKPDDCRKLLALLAKQLLVIDKLAGLLIQSKVDGITHIHRTEVEPGPASTDALAVPISDDPKALYKTYPFELEFTCDTDSLRAFLNGLTQSDWFFAVRSVKVDSASAASTGTSPAPAATRGSEPAPPPRPTEHRLLNVIVRVDLVEFAPTESPAKNAS